jgi:hypothetical protein
VALCPTRFATRFSRQDVFFSAWFNLGLLMVARAQDADKNRILAVVNWHANWMWDQGRSMAWGGLMAYHYEVLRRRCVQHGFRWSKWYDQVDQWAYPKHVKVRPTIPLATRLTGGGGSGGGERSGSGTGGGGRGVLAKGKKMDARTAEVCNSFNSEGGCSYQRCVRRHVCGKCGAGSHGKSVCLK